MSNLKVKISLFLFFLFTLFFYPANAATCTWKGGNGNWSDTSKWTCGRVPDAETDIVIDPTVIINLDTDVTMASLKITGGATILGKGNITIKKDLWLVTGIIETEGNVTINGNLTWGAANIIGKGTVIIEGHTKMINLLHYLSEKLVILNGGGTWLEGDIAILKGAELRIPVGQTLKEEGRTKMIYNYNPPANGIINIEGTFLKSGTEDIDISNAFLKNSGNIEVTNGTLTINAAFQNTGTIKVQGKESPTLGIKIFGTTTAPDTALARRLLEDAKALIPKIAFMGALPRLEKAAQILKKTDHDTLNVFFGEVLFYTASCYSEVHSSMRRFAEALDLIDILIDRYVPLFGLNSDLTARTYELKALTFYNTAKLSEAIKTLPKAIDLRTKLSGELPTLTMRFRLAQSYARKGDFEKAIFYYTQLLNIEDKFKTNLRRSGIYNDLGIVYKNLGEYEKSLFYQNKGIDIIEKTLGLNDFRLMQGYENRGITMKHLGKYDDAITDFEHAYKLALSFWPEGTYPDFANFYLNMADTYTLKSDYSKAIIYYEKAITLYQKFKEQEAAIAECHYGMAGTYLKMGSTDSVSAHLKLAEKFNHYTHKGHFEGTTDLAQLLKVFALQNKNYQLAYKQTHQRIYLDSAYQAAQSGIEAMDFIKKELAFSEGRSRLIKDNYPIYEGMLQTLKVFQQDSTDKQAFQVAEQCKSLQLYEAVKNAEAISFGKIPPQYIEQEKALQAQLAKFDKQKQQLMAKNVAETDSIYTTTMALQLETQLKYDALKSDIAKQYSNYYHLRYGDDKLTLTDVQTKLLKPNQTLIEYFVGDSSLFTFIIKPNFYKVIEIKKDFPLENWVKILRGALSADSFQTQANIYADMAFRLYEKLIKPVKEHLSEELIIVPDGVIGYIPFEALLTQKPEKAIRFHDHAYLLRSHSISYAFSATMLREMMQKKHRIIPTTPLIAYAPFFNNDTMALSKIYADDIAMRRDLIPLSNSGEEVYRIAKAMGGKAIIGKNATEQQFIETAPSARILHLATHGKADDKAGDYAFLAFASSQNKGDNNTLLYVRDLYNLTLNTDMVVLSACETGIGKLQRGEGIISLARAFAYSGAKSIVTSLWAVNDAKTKDLMLLFYRNLKRGKTKDAALREAKLSFIEANSSSNANPFFWAAFIGIGDMSAVK